MNTYGLVFGQHTYVVAHNTASDINQIVNSPGTARNIEERVTALRSVTKITNVSNRWDPRCPSLKLVT